MESRNPVRGARNVGRSGYFGFLNVLGKPGGGLARPVDWKKRFLSGFTEFSKYFEVGGETSPISQFSTISTHGLSTISHRFSQKPSHY